MKSHKHHNLEDPFVATIRDPLVREQIKQMLESYYREGYRKGLEEGLQKRKAPIEEAKLG
ncbi:hypothetical protein BTR22_15435 [Alkalihalophilus pseudofirmus]|uniref:hypothetical protein n=1 Tax=Alkalihalophilus pseudofirmus TaxID=79885 RepID=UPI0009526B85|nr:hypothetical protein [Alkalihalophilus pseudofirmus]OLS35491.1 hypothetical protein BTR22_15435 [Alkalihalophilus pseudofirmus]WEG17163.1 hypothetical protein PQ478_01135 [Alkalihalophilus pseudofirmus]